MKISVTVFVILISTYIVNASVLDPVIENVVHLKASKPPRGVAGIWKKKTIWKPRWVKEWKSSKVMKPVWRKVWSPVQIREWVPIPKPPPGWESISTPLALVHPKPQKAPLKDSLGHDSFPVRSATKLPLWDPVPYPESQQPPPPPPFPQPSPNADVSCGKGGCDNSPSHTFNHQQISEILGPRYQSPEHFQNPDYSETVNHLTRLPPEGNNWRTPQPLPDFQFDNRFNNFQGLPEFLVPPKSLSENDFRLRLPNNESPPSHPPGSELQSAVRWTPPSPENKIKGHFVTKPPDHPYKFHFPEVHLPNSNGTNQVQNGESDFKEKRNFQTHDPRPQADGDFIQEAQLVGEYHYSEFDLPGTKLEAKKPQPNSQDQVQVNLHEKAKGVESEGPKRLAAKPQPPVDTKPRQTRTEMKQPEVHKPQGERNVGKTHLPNPPPQPTPNFQQQIKEIFPIFKPLPTENPPHSLNHRFQLPKNNQNQEKSLPPNHSLTKSVEAQNPQSNSPKAQQQNKIYPNYETTKIPSPNVLPSNHRFEPQEKLRNDSTIKLLPSFDSSQKPELEKLTKPENPSPNRIQLVFPTTPTDHNQLTENYKKTTTTEPYEVIFSSSLLSTTETVTKSPIIIVTPVSSES